ncbi:uncharacterized protein LOC129795947 [Lutzomyia longipalpis]|uniref:uncharacterized protein LOC129795947 n=1 Tax=Lutzomyia longipalpis TaxID=7200 RepID=UPI0024837F7C|nr:uncharacterized protein LOC129795947 [Lutzomyia longipalpis]
MAEVEGNGSNQYNRHALPEFLNQDFLLDVLRSVENDKALVITECNIAPATKPGDHHGSIMFRAKISYKTRGKDVISRSFVIKTKSVDEEPKKKMLKECPAFEREIDIYMKILPEMTRIMESIGDRDHIAPRFLYHSMDPLVLIFEDITTFGYEMHTELCNFENTAKVAKKLAKFHALSFYMHDNKYVYNIDFPQYNGLRIIQEIILAIPMILAGLALMKEEVKKWEGYEKIAEKIGDITEKHLISLLDMYKPNPEPGFNVLCHSDIHIKNMMFIKKNTDIDKILLLDFQMCFWGSQAVDLLHFLYRIGDASVRLRRGEMVSIYHNTFTDYLNQLGCLRQGPTLLELNIELLKLAPLELILGIWCLPMKNLDSSKFDAAALENSTPEIFPNMLKIFLKTPRIVEIFKEVLLQLYYKGALG